MNTQHHIDELRAKIHQIEQEPIKGWLHRITKLAKVKKIERKIRSLEKSLKNKHE